ncbi:MAG TPA: hypothetical protein VIN08_22435 [Ohtaekwangia sp.]|uniref:hypothetical protein n=1 Tax=Ohtaekwangia sp. TaxID=2066019 RepID=UPI002F952552
MPLKKSSRKILMRVFVAMIPLLILFGILVYAKLYGFKRALSDLVESKTDGLYALSIGHSSIDMVELTFTLKDVVIRRTSAAPARGIRQVSIPYMKLKFGSLASMSMVRQFDIQNLIIDEPQIEIEAAQQRAVVVKPTSTNLTYQMVKLYPAIESLLGRFDIEALSIRRATVGMNNLAKTSIRLGLIDLLVEHWNIQRLTANSQLQLKVGGQQLAFPKASLNFSGIEFNFKKHHLLFSDFRFASLDTVSQSRVEVSGRSLLLQKLDYKALYENQRYAIKRAELDHPNVIAEFKLKRDTTRIKDRDLLTRILKQAIGECSVDSTVIRDARVHLIVQKDRDSVKIDLPHVNFNVYAFKVVRDSSTFQVGGLEVGLDRTAIALRRNFSFNCDAILFDKYRDLTITDVVLYDSATQKTIARCGKLKLKYFNLLMFLFDKKFHADELSLEDADIHITPERIKQRSQRKDDVSDIRVRSLSLRNVNINYADSVRTIRVSKLSVSADNLKQDVAGNFQYHIDNIHFYNAYIKNIRKHFESKLKDIDFNGQSFHATIIEVNKDSLHVRATDISARKDGAEPIQRNYKHWQVLQVKNLEMEGILPRHTGNKLESIEHALELGVIDEVQVNRLNMSLRKGNKSIACTGKDIVLKNVTSQDDKFRLESVRGQFSSVNFSMPQTTLSANQVNVNYPDRISVKDIRFVKDHVNVQSAQLVLETIEPKEHYWSIGSIRTRFTGIDLDSNTLFHCDSTVMLHAELATDDMPSVNRLEVYNPLLRLSERNAPKAKASEGKDVSFAMVKHFVFHPGVIQWNNNKAISFGKLEGDIRQGILNCAFVRSETPRMQIEVYDVVLKDNTLRMDSVVFDPKEEWITSNQFEEDVIRASFHGIVLKGFSTEDLVESHIMNHVAVSVNRFSFDIHRDKRMPDLPHKEKPVTLEQMLKLPHFVNLSSVDLKKGKLRYTEVSEKTENAGVVMLDDIAAAGKFNANRTLVLHATAKLYDEGNLDMQYESLDTASFNLKVHVKDLNLVKLNRALVPLLSVQVRSGYLKDYDLQITANAEEANGTAIISYDNLHLEILNRNEPDKKTLGSELLTILADGIIVKNSKENAIASVTQSRIKHKAIFNYWVKSALQGAMGGVKRGKNRKLRV